MKPTEGLTASVPADAFRAYEKWATNIAEMHGGGDALARAILDATLEAREAGAAVDDPAVRRELIAKAHAQLSGISG